MSCRGESGSRPAGYGDPTEAPAVDLSCIPLREESNCVRTVAARRSQAKSAAASATRHGSSSGPEAPVRPGPALIGFPLRSMLAGWELAVALCEGRQAVQHGSYVTAWHSITITPTNPY